MVLRLIYEMEKNLARQDGGQSPLRQGEHHGRIKRVRSCFKYLQSNFVEEIGTAHNVLYQIRLLESLTRPSVASRRRAAERRGRYYNNSMNTKRRRRLSYFEHLSSRLQIIDISPFLGAICPVPYGAFCDGTL